MIRNHIDGYRIVEDDAATLVCTWVEGDTAVSIRTLDGDRIALIGARFVNNGWLADVLDRHGYGIIDEDMQSQTLTRPIKGA